MKPLAALRDFLALESAGGLLLAGAALLALGFANSPWAGVYGALVDTPVAIRAGSFEFGKPLLLWINDGLMAVFFFLVGLELKREVLEGELSSASQIVLPAAAAAGGMLIPGLIYAGINWDHAANLRGWAIPTATDIAFALGVLSLLGSRVPPALKVFLLTLAVLDDLGAIVIIAAFYTENLAAGALPVAAGALLALTCLTLMKVQRVTPYALFGLVLWASVLKSGVHATLAGVALAFFIPRAPARRLEEDLHPLVAFGILPVFAFANAGVSLAGVSMQSLLAPVPLGIAAGLLLGKPLGVLLAVFVVTKSRLATLPEGATWASMLGVGLLCGVGFTMSLFIGSLAFEGLAMEYATHTRLGILAGSLASALGGYAVLRVSLRR